MSNTPTYQMYPAPIFEIVAMSAAVSSAEFVLEEVLNYPDQEPLWITPTLYRALNALRTVYADGLSNRIRKQCASDLRGVEGLEHRLMALKGCAADAASAIQGGVMVYLAEVEARLDDMTNEADFSPITTTGIIRILVEAADFFRSGRDSAARIWIATNHPQSAGRAFSVVMIDPTCPLLVISSVPPQPWITDAELDVQAHGVFSKALYTGYDQAIGTAFSYMLRARAEPDSPPEPTN